MAKGKGRRIPFGKKCIELHADCVHNHDCNVGERGEKKINI